MNRKKSEKNCFLARTRLHVIRQKSFSARHPKPWEKWRACGGGIDKKAENCTQAKEQKIEMKIIFYLFSITFFLIFRYHLIPLRVPGSLLIVCILFGVGVENLFSIRRWVENTAIKKKLVGAFALRCASQFCSDTAGGAIADEDPDDENNNKLIAL